MVAQKRSGSSGPGGTDLEALRGWLLKFEEDSTRLCTSVETFFDWLANGSSPWAAYREFMSGHLLALEKQPGVRTVGGGETWRHLFAVCRNQGRNIWRNPGGSSSLGQTIVYGGMVIIARRLK